MHRTSRILVWPFYALLADVAVMAVVAGAAFLDDGSTTIGAFLVVTAVVCLAAIAGWLNRRRFAKPLSLLVALMGVPLCLFLAAAALDPFTFDYDGPSLSTGGTVVHGVAFLLVAVNMAFIGAAILKLKNFDTHTWLER